MEVSRIKNQVSRFKTFWEFLRIESSVSRIETWVNGTVLHCAVHPGWICEGARWSESCSLTGWHPEGAAVKMAGYWLRSFCVFMDVDFFLIKAKKNFANIQPSWPHAWSIMHVQLSWRYWLTFISCSTALPLHPSEASAVVPRDPNRKFMARIKKNDSSFNLIFIFSYFKNFIGVNLSK